MGWLARYRHGRGFGVHSPFAYRFIREVLRERTPYYDYASLPGERQRLVYRLAVFFQPTHIVALGDADARPALMACPEPGSERHPAEWLIEPRTRLAVASGLRDMAPAIDAIGCGVVVCLCYDDPQQMRQLRQAMDALGYGMTFDNRKGWCVAVPFAHLPRQDFDVRY